LRRPPQFCDAPRGTKTPYPILRRPVVHCGEAPKNTTAHGVLRRLAQFCGRLHRIATRRLIFRRAAVIWLRSGWRQKKGACRWARPSGLHGWI
jgi:hypothetical protein